ITHYKMSKNENVSFLDKISNSLQSLFESAKRMFRSIFAKESQVLFLGIDNAGKTTLIHKLRKDMTNTFEPTRAPSAYDIEIGNMKTAAIDLGGHEAARMAWSEYFIKCDGIIFLVDTADEKRFSIVKEAWQMVKQLRARALLQGNPDKITTNCDISKIENNEDPLESLTITQNEKLQSLPVVVLMNKIDRLNHNSNTIYNDTNLQDYIQSETGIYDSASELSPVRIIWLSLVEEGLEGGILDAFLWLDKMMQK
ncbi:Vesicle coat complex COPII, GTPase subunit SAR1, partial [Pseudoloma neurophilia]